MAIYLVCLTSGSGIPVFTRSVGNVKPLPFPVIGSLNAVHMFAANHNAVLKSTTTEDARIVWKEFESSLVLILIQGRDSCPVGDGPGGVGGDSPSTLPGARLLDLIWDAMIFLYGKDDLLNIRNVERFKREIKVCFQLVDAMLQQAASPLFSDLTMAVDVLMASDAAVLQTFVDAFAEAAESPYCCLMVGGRLVCATERWWSLTAVELVLLSTLVTWMAQCSARDVPVYLPHGSPSIPHRLMTFELLRDVTVCVICGPKPPLVDLEKEIGRFWVPAVDTLRSVRQTTPRNLPVSMELDTNILGFLLINTCNHRCLNSFNLTRDGRGQMEGGRNRDSHGEEQARVEKRRAVLRSFYTMVVGAYFNASGSGEESGPGDLSHQPTDTYIVCSGHKCYAHTSGNYQVYVLFCSKTPTFAMRSVTQKLLNLLIKDKNCPL